MLGIFKLHFFNKTRSLLSHTWILSIYPDPYILDCYISNYLNFYDKFWNYKDSFVTVYLEGLEARAHKFIKLLEGMWDCYFIKKKIRHMMFTINFAQNIC